VKKNGKSRGREQSAQKQLMLPLRGLARAALWDTVVISGLAFLEAAMEAERAALCGPRYAHLPLVCEPGGAKLSKSRRVFTLADEFPAQQLWRILTLLRQSPPTELARAPPSARTRRRIGPRRRGARASRRFVP